MAVQVLHPTKIKILFNGVCPLGVVRIWYRCLVTLYESGSIFTATRPLIETKNDAHAHNRLEKSAAKVLTKHLVNDDSKTSIAFWSGMLLRYQR